MKHMVDSSTAKLRHTLQAIVGTFCTDAFRTTMTPKMFERSYNGTMPMFYWNVDMFLIFML
jgi:hypothetical protein